MTAIQVCAAIQVILNWLSINTLVNTLPVTSALAAISLYHIFHTSSLSLHVHLRFFLFGKGTSIHTVR